MVSLGEKKDFTIKLKFRVVVKFRAMLSMLHILSVPWLIINNSTFSSQSLPKDMSPTAQQCTVFALSHLENTIILLPLGCEIAVQPLLNMLQS